VTPRRRSALTLGVLALLLVVGGLWGWSALTAPFPHEVDPPVCVDQDIAAGDKLFRDQVTVSVFNASRRSGLAGATLASLEERGFAAGDVGDAPADTSVRQVEIWTDQPDNPAVRLVRTQLRRATVVQGEALGAGVVVVLGDAYAGLAKGRQSVPVRDEATVCGPPDAG
jgi:hypothetical protein